MLQKMPVLLIAIIISIIAIEQFLPIEFKQIVYAASLTIKSIIVFVLPMIIFALLFKAAVNLSNHTLALIVLIVGGVCFSNFTSTFLSHFVGMFIYNFNMSIVLPSHDQGLNPAWSFEMPKLIPNNYAMFLGVCCGTLAVIASKDWAVRVADRLEKIINIILGLIVYLIPIFVAGFVTKLQYDNIMHMILKNYASIFMIIAFAQLLYVGILYLAANNFQVRAAINSIKNMIPAVILGFSAMSSAAAMPLTIMGAQNNSKNKELVKSIIPATASIHLIGDCFAIPIFAYAVLKNYNMAEPEMLNYLIFAIYFVIAKFSVAAIPGGGIIVMLPILEAHLGFNTDMCLLITALYVLFDPVITSVNVLGNGAFAKIVDSYWERRKLKLA